MGDQFDVNLSNYNMYTPTNDIDNIFLSNTVHKAIIGIIIIFYYSLRFTRTADTVLLIYSIRTENGI